VTLQLISIPAMILANLCVCYIMTNQNEKAEDILKRVEKEEERMSFQDQSKRQIHLCIINLVIGTPPPPSLTWTRDFVLCQRQLRIRRQPHHQVPRAV
jgi:hypothetical protein